MEDDQGHPLREDEKRLNRLPGVKLYILDGADI